MRLVVLEGYNDLQFFRSFLTKSMEFNVTTNRNVDLVNEFKKLLAENPEMARVEILSKDQDELVLLSVGGKDNFTVIAEGIKGLVVKFRRKGKPIESILLVVDKDAEEIVMEAKSIIKRAVANVDVVCLIYDCYLEDIIERLIKSIPENDDVKILNELIHLIETNYRNDEYLRKRKLSVIHAVLGPRCFGHLFDTIFKRYVDYSSLNNIKELKEFYLWLSKC